MAVVGIACAAMCARAENTPGAPPAPPANLAPPAIAAPPAISTAPAFAAPKLGGYIQARETAQERVGLTATLNRARFSMDGGLSAGFTYRFLVELEAATGARTAAAVSLREAIIKWTLASWSVTAGQFKTPFSRAYLILVPQLETADLAAAVDSLAPKYDVGAMTEYALGPVATATVGVFNGEGQNATANRDSMVMVVGRLVLRPVAQLGLGASVTRDGSDSLRWGVDLNIEDHGAVLRAEYLTRHRRGRAPREDDFGWYVFGGYRATPRLQLIVQEEDFERPSLGQVRRVRATVLGANIEIAPNRVRLLLEGMRRRSGANQARSDVLVAQLQVKF